MDEKGENAQVLDTVKLPTCTHLDIKHDVTLRGGIKSGNFTKLGYLRDMQTCVDACCQDQKCDVAFMPGHVCYSVSCFSAKLCESIPAIPSIAANRSVRISHVVRGGGKGDDLEQFKKTQGMAKYSKMTLYLNVLSQRFNQQVPLYHLLGQNLHPCLQFIECPFTVQLLHFHGKHFLIDTDWNPEVNEVS